MTLSRCFFDTQGTTNVYDDQVVVEATTNGETVAATFDRTGANRVVELRFDGEGGG